jgi:signal transduction histidine kinase
MSITVDPKMVTEDSQASPKETPLQFIEKMKVIRLATIGRITSTIVHEINNPMQSIQGGASLGLEELGNPEATKLYFELIRRESTRVLKLTEILRSIYHPDSTVIEPVSLMSIIDEVILLVKDDFNQKSIVFEKKVVDDLSPIFIPRPLLIIALLNIFLNLNDAIMLTGHRKLTLKVENNIDKATLEFSTSFPFEIDPHKVEQKNFVDLSIADNILKPYAVTIELVPGQSSSALQVVMPIGETGKAKV